MRRTRDGFGTPTTFTGKSDRDDFEAACLLDRYFCRVENPQNGILEKYLPWIKKEAEFGYKNHIFTFRLRGFEPEDVFSLAMCYAVSFLGLYSLEKDSAKMELFVKRYQEKNKTTDLPPEEIVFKKNRSDLVDFLKQKIRQLSMVVKKKGSGVSMFDTKVLYYKTQGKLNIDKQILSTVKDGYKGFFKVTQKDYLKIKKELKTKRKEFDKDGWHYFCVEKQSLQIEYHPMKAQEDEIAFDLSEVPESANAFCGSEDSIDYLSDFYDKYTKQEKIDMITSYIEKSKSAKKKEIARKLLQELQE